MRTDLLKKVELLDREYFGERPLPRLISALSAQVKSMEKEPTASNVHKQAGDALFVLVSMARNMGWDCDELLADVITKVEKRREERHYYEAHVTIEPVFEERRETFVAICRKHDFHVAELLMQRKRKDTPNRSSKDAFCTGRSISYSDLEDRMKALLAELTVCRFAIWRYKIESTLLDSRHDDSLIPLDHRVLPDREKSPRAPAKGALAGRK